MNIVKRVARRLAGDGDAPAIAKLTSEIVQLRREVQRLSRAQDGLRAELKILPKIVTAQRNDGKWRSIFRAQLGALVRLQYVAARPELTTIASLRARRFRLHSQNEEDGLVLALLDAAGVGRRAFVEIGSGGTGGNSAVLADELGWEGLMVEASKRGAAVATELFRHNRGVAVVRTFATPENINQLIADAGCGGDVALLSIDVDSIDYWLFDALDVAGLVQPRVIVTEYNAHFGPTRAVTLPNAPRPASAPKPYFGASLTALTKVAERKGYRLVLCEENGINAFFLRNGLAPELPGARPEDAYRPMRRRLGADEDEPVIEDVYALAAAAGLPIVEV